MDPNHDLEESQATPDQSTHRGSALARALEEKTAELKYTQKQVAQILELSYPYYALLLSGERWFGSVNKEKLINIAKFLGISTASVYMLAEVLEISDWYESHSLERQVEAAFKTMQKDRRYTMALPTPAKWAEASLDMKLTVVMLYQDLSNKHLLEKFKLIEVCDPEQDPSQDEQ